MFSENDLVSWLSNNAAIIISWLIFGLPTIIAIFRSHSYTFVIFIINLLFGHSTIGWIIALVWSVVPTRR
jgi:hypothetical protein